MNEENQRFSECALRIITEYISSDSIFIGRMPVNEENHRFSECALRIITEYISSDSIFIGRMPVNEENHRFSECALRIITERQGFIMKLDMHCHTREGSPDGKVTLLDNISILKAKGFGGMLITDHNSYKAYRHYIELEDKPTDFTVLCGIEYDTLDAGHILVIMPAGIQPRIMEKRGLPVGLLIEIVHLYGGILGPAHPCGEKFLSIFNTRVGKLLLDKLMQKFDFIEAFNACEEDASNDKARALADKYSLPVFGGSDSHKEDCVGLGYVILEKNVANETELIEYLKKGSPTTAGGTHYFHTTKQKLGRANNILVYSFWFYNKFLAFIRTHARSFELKNNLLLQSVRCNKYRYIKLLDYE